MNDDKFANLVFSQTVSIKESYLSKDFMGTVRSCAMDKTFGKRAPHSVEGTGRARRLAANRDLVGVITEVPDILLHPPHSCLLIQYPIVSRAVVSGLSREVGVGEESKGSESIVDCRHDDSFRC